MATVDTTAAPPISTEVGKLDDPAPSKGTVVTADRRAAPPIGAEVGDPALSEGTVTTGDRIATPPISVEVGDPTPSGDTVTTGDRIAAPSIGVEIGKLDGPAPSTVATGDRLAVPSIKVDVGDPTSSGNTVATEDRLTTPPISVDMGKLDTAAAPDESTINVVEEPTTATCTLTDEVGRPAAANEDSTALLTWLTSALKAPAGDVAAIRAVTTLALPDPELPV